MYVFRSKSYFSIIPGSMMPYDTSSLQQNLKMAKLSSFLLLVILSSTNAGLRSRAGDDQEEKTCIPCSYLGLQTVCFPRDMLPPRGSKWNCHRHEEEEVEETGIWDCLVSGTDSSSCAANSEGSCIWCAEPVFGLCVTPRVADKIGNLPYFSCGSSTSEAQ